jgi:hypothetical protein
MIGTVPSRGIAMSCNKTSVCLAAGSLILLQSLLFPGVQPLNAEMPTEFRPVATLTFGPIAVDDDNDRSEPLRTKPFTPPEVRPYDEKTWRKIKKAAEFDPKTQEPDSIVSPPVAVEALVPPFDGWGNTGTTPPDPTLARSGQRVLQAVNGGISLFDANGTLLHGRTLANFFGASAFPFDPRVLYDRNSMFPRYFVVATSFNSGPPASSTMHLAISRSPDPSNLNSESWCRYALSTTNDFGSGLPTFPDQPNIGVGDTAFVISANHATISTLQFTYAH